ncbi:MAG: hypothetical protein DI535_26045 [Citrobacter freundii]|nr:MAG: hypothetical protein DI535_26045 [Citrobacter freundii]
MREQPDYIWFLLTRELSGEATKAELGTLQKWLSESPDHQQQYELLKQLWQAKVDPEKSSIGSSKLSRIFQLATVEEVLQAKSEWLPKRAIRKIANWKIATLLIIIALCTWALLSWIVRTV